MMFLKIQVQKYKPKWKINMNKIFLSLLASFLIALATLPSSAYSEPGENKQLIQSVKIDLIIDKYKF